MKKSKKNLLLIITIILIIIAIIFKIFYKKKILIEKPHSGWSVSKANVFFNRYGRYPFGFLGWVIESGLQQNKLWKKIVEGKVALSIEHHIETLPVYLGQEGLAWISNTDKKK